jgi:hypothetical protein
MRDAEGLLLWVFCGALPGARLRVAAFLDSPFLEYGCGQRNSYSRTAVRTAGALNATTFEWCERLRASRSPMERGRRWRPRPFT